MGQIRRTIRKIKTAKRPVIYAGGGILLSQVQEELLTFAKQNSIPVITSLMGIGAFPEDHPLYAGIVGSHGYEYSNHIMDEADLCICVGARMSDRGTMNNVGSMNDMELIHIDIDPAEIGKNIDDTNIPIVGDARIVLSDLIEKDINKDTKTWIAGIEKIKEEHPVLCDCHLDLDLVNPKL
ncbi:MAG: biosynthetic-type acetolactate synthase large subunit, partial [Eubacterium aggregans]